MIFFNQFVRNYLHIRVLTKNQNINRINIGTIVALDLKVFLVVLYTKYAQRGKISTAVPKKKEVIRINYFSHYVVFAGVLIDSNNESVLGQRKYPNHR